MMYVSAANEAAAAETLRVYFGTYSGTGSQGIYVAELDEAGKLTEPRVAAELVNPSFLEIHPTRQWLYAVGEISDFQGQKTGGVSALAIEAASGGLRLLNQQPSGGAGPCHVTVDPAGKNVLVANYGAGSVASYPLMADGRLEPAASVVQHQGSSVNSERQAGPHAHSINVDARGRWAIAADLGLDQLLVYRLEGATGKLTANEPAFARVAAGSGPRHFAWHPSGRLAFCNNEMSSTVTSWQFDGTLGTFTEVETQSTLPADYREPGNSTAEIRVHPSGRFVYVSNRGHNSLAIFEVDGETGKLTARGHASSGGKIPRNFNLTPDGRWLLAANQDSDNVVVLAVDAATGSLRATGVEVTVPRPVCVRFVSLGD